LNADGIVAVTGQLLTANMFTYCLNNPVNLDDPTGYLAMVEYVVRDNPYYRSSWGSNNTPFVSRALSAISTVTTTSSAFVGSTFATVGKNALAVGDIATYNSAWNASAITFIGAQAVQTTCIWVDPLNSHVKGKVISAHVVITGAAIGLGVLLGLGVGALVTAVPFLAPAAPWMMIAGNTFIGYQLSRLESSWIDRIRRN
jgi:hypothetical protein